jgi:hypothetical protein
MLGFNFRPSEPITRMNSACHQRKFRSSPHLASRERGATAPKMRLKNGRRLEKIWKGPLSVWGPCKPLKFHKTAKAFFGNAWRKPGWIWKSLEKSLQTRFVPPSFRRERAFTGRRADGGGGSSHLQNRIEVEDGAFGIFTDPKCFFVWKMIRRHG